MIYATELFSENFGKTLKIQYDIKKLKTGVRTAHMKIKTTIVLILVIVVIIESQSNTKHENIKTL